MHEESTGYDADSIQVLSNVEAIRKRPGMYIGSTGERGLHSLVIEAAEWAMEEILAGRAGRAEVTLLSDGGVRVFSDGVGPGLDVQLDVILVGRPSGLGYVPIGLAGVGLVVVNALSSRLIREQNEGGTTLTFWPDPEIFETTEISFEVLAERFTEVACLNRAVDISLADERHSVRFHFPDGVRNLVGFLDEQDPAAFAHPDIIGFERDDRIEIALRWRTSGPARVHSFANSRPTRGDGVHVTGLHEGLVAAINAFARDRGRLAPTAPDLTEDQICEGLTAVVSVKLEDASFEGCLRDRLGNPGLRAEVSQAVREHLGTWLTCHPQPAAAIVDRIVSPSRAA